MKRVRPLLGNRLNLTNNKLVDVNLACRKFGFQILQDGEFIMYEGFLIIYFYFFLSLSLKLDNLELKAAEMKKKNPHGRPVTCHLFQNFVAIQYFISAADSVFSHNLKVSIKSFGKANLIYNTRFPAKI